MAFSSLSARAFATPCFRTASSSTCGSASAASAAASAVTVVSPSGAAAASASAVASAAGASALASVVGSLDAGSATGTAASRRFFAASISPCPQPTPEESGGDTHLTPATLYRLQVRDDHVDIRVRHLLVNHRD